MAFDLTKLFASLQTKKISTPTKVVGIDFGSASLKVVELEKRDDGIALTTYGELQLGPYVESPMGSAVKLPLQKKTEALVDVMRESGVTAKDVVFAMPLSDSFITVMSLPLGSAEDLATRVQVEARKYIPVPITDVALEWVEVTVEEKGIQPLKHDVLIVAIQTEAISETRSLLDSVGAGAKPVEIELFSTIRALVAETDTAVAMIDFGGTVSKLYITYKGVVQRLHRVPTGGTHATQRIATELSITVEDAENRKRNYSSADPQADVIKTSVEQTAFRAIQEFQRLLDQYEKQSGIKVSRVVVAGGVTLFPDFLMFVSYTLSREVTKATPFKKVLAPAFLEDTLDSIGPTFAPALGAALRHFE